MMLHQTRDEIHIGPVKEARDALLVDIRDILFARDGSLIGIEPGTQFLMLDHAMLLQPSDIGGNGIEMRRSIGQVLNDITRRKRAVFPQHLHDLQFLVCQLLHMRIVLGRCKYNYIL